jgi:hypothetical protein
MKKIWIWVSAIILIIAIIFGYFFYIFIGMKCDNYCKSNGYLSGFCKTVATVPELIEQVETEASAEEAPGWEDHCFNLGNYLGSKNMCFCKK